MKNVSFGFLFGLCALVLAACAQNTPTVNFSATLSGTDQVPAVTTGGTGRVTATLSGQSLTLRGTFSGLSGAPTEAHIHEGAPGTDGPVVFPLTLRTVTMNSGSLEQTIQLSGAQVATLTSNGYYVNVHTAEHPDGEIRGQLERLLE